MGEEDRGQPGSGFGWRHIVTLLGFFGFFVVYVLRVNLSVGIVAMVNQTAIAAQSRADQINITGDVCMREIGPANVTTKPPKEGPFVWDEETQGLILGSFFYGYIITQIPGGWLAGRFGAKWVFGIGTLWTAVLTLLTPITAQLGVPYFIALRVLEGIGEGVTFPAMNAMFAVWSSPMERSKFPAFTYSGAYVGTVFSFIASGYMCDSNFLGGWPSVFYVFGAIGVIWFGLWAWLTTSFPENHPYISDEEKEFIRSEIAKENRKEVSTPPWGSILTSLPVWALVISHTSHNWGFYTLLTELPTFLRHLAPGLCLIGVGYVNCNRTAAVALLVLSVGLSGLNGAGFVCNHLDLAPKYSGVLFGLTNSVATIPGILGPYVETFDSWRKVFFLTAGIYFFSVIFYAFAASGNVQNWARDELPEDERNISDYEELLGGSEDESNSIPT